MTFIKDPLPKSSLKQRSNKANRHLGIFKHRPLKDKDIVIQMMTEKNKLLSPPFT